MEQYLPPDIFTYVTNNYDGYHTLTRFHENCNGLKGKFDEFMLSIVAQMPQMFCLSKHHLNMRKLRLLIFQTMKYLLNISDLPKNVVGSVFIYI